MDKDKKMLLNGINNLKDLEYPKILKRTTDFHKIFEGEKEIKLLKIKEVYEKINEDHFLEKMKANKKLNLN